MDATYAWMLRRRGLLRTRLVAGLNVAGASVRYVLFKRLARRDPDRWARPIADNREWSRVHRLGLQRRGRVGVLSAPPASENRDASRT
jgi:hypothetical protein